VVVISKLGCGQSCRNGCTMAWLGLAWLCTAMAVAAVEAATVVV